jgi:DeoR/GlpR family transcriptional regulator of sugar metabolism
MSSLQPEQRRQNILSDLAQDGDKQIAMLSEKYGVSEMTIRRDLKQLEDQGLVRRTYGGAIPVRTAIEDLRIVAREKRQKRAAEQKARMARFAAQHCVDDDDIIILGGGTTTAAMIPHLAEKRHLTVLTNCVHNTFALQNLNLPDMTVICSGGILRQISSTFVGPLTERCFREIHAKKLFLSATGISLEAAVTDPNMHETQVKRAMIESADQLIMLMDSSKFGIRSLMTVVTYPEIDVLITDSGCPPQIVDAIRGRGVDLRIAPD